MNQKYYAPLAEKDQRRYAAVEALKLGVGGHVYIARILGCSEKTVHNGLADLANLPDEAEDEAAIRKPGGGRKRYDAHPLNIAAQFLSVLKAHTAGDPMDEKVMWTDLTPQEMAQKLAQEHQVKVSKRVVNKLLKKHNYRRRKAQKKQTIKSVPQRNAQFVKIEALVAEDWASDHPIISFDTQKKENLGNFYRAGHLYTREEWQAYDHDVSSLADGVILPHGIYDRKNNIGYLHLGTSQDTSQVACDGLRAGWLQHGRVLFPKASSILAQCDGGGSKSSRHYIFKEDLQRLSDELGIEIRIAHSPPYCSKYNPSEHRVFPHVTRACQGVLFTSIDLVKQLRKKTKTSKGLKVFVEIIDTVYQIGRKVADDFKQNMRIVCDDFLPVWNYRAIPNQIVI